MPSPPACPQEEEAVCSSAAAWDGAALGLGGGKPGELPLEAVGQHHLPSQATQSVSTGPRSRYIPVSWNPSVDTVHVRVSCCCNISGNQTILDCLSEWGTLFLRGQPILSLSSLRVEAVPLSKPAQMVSLPVPGTTPSPALAARNTHSASISSPSQLGLQRSLPVPVTTPSSAHKEARHQHRHLLCAPEVPTMCHFACISPSTALWHVMMGGWVFSWTIARVIIFYPELIFIEVPGTLPSIHSKYIC